MLVGLSDSLEFMVMRLGAAIVGILAVLAVWYQVSAESRNDT
jgi:hypothetical protein